VTTPPLPAVGAKIWIASLNAICEGKVGSHLNGGLSGTTEDGASFFMLAANEGITWFRTDPRVKPAEATITMRERFELFVVSQCAKLGGLYAADATRCAVDFAESEVRLALAPREQSPEVTKAEDWLRGQQEQRCDIIASELDRLRNLVRSLGGTP
jgi:hypothetical protein